MLLADQDRSLWDREQIARGRVSLARALALGGRGPYALQAAIAARHAEQPCDWPAIAELYAPAGGAHRLAGRGAQPRGRARRVGRGRRRRSRSSTASTSAPTTTCTPRARSCCAGSGARDDARAAYERALELVHADAERSLLQRRLAELDAAQRAAPRAD